MMESSNLDHHHHQQDLHGIGTSSFPPLPFHEVGSHHKCNQTLIFNNGDFIPSTNGAMVQDLGFQWANTAPSYMNQETMPQIKEEFLDSSNNNDLQAGDMPFFGGNFSLVLPHTNFNSDMNPLPPSFPFSMAMDLRSLDHILASSKFARSFYHPSMNSVMFFNEDTLHELGHHHHHQHHQQQQADHKMKTLAHGVSEEKTRANTICQSTSTSQATTKKHRPDLRSSFSHFKVRKEKLGDRIAALQQLVAPFGKTDTASVLMEAIGYIKFLQDQVETLSVPYMRSSGNKKLRTIIPGEGKSEHNTDLRSRGLCLVPLSCTSYVTDENGVGLCMSSPNFRGGT